MLKNNLVFYLVLTILYGCKGNENQSSEREEMFNDSVSIKQEEIEKQIEDSKKDLVITERAWLPYDHDYPVGNLYISIQNNGQIDYKDVVIKIEYYAKSGTYLGEDTMTLYEIFPVGKVVTLNEVNTGLAPDGSSYGIASIVSAQPYN